MDTGERNSHETGFEMRSVRVGYYFLVIDRVNECILMKIV